MNSSVRKQGNAKGAATLSLPIALHPERLAKVAQEYGVQTLALFNSDVELETVWDVVQNDLPRLQHALEKLEQETERR